MTRTAMILVLAATVASGAQPPFDFTGPWTGTLVVGDDIRAVDVNITSNAGKKFAGGAVLDEATCVLRGTRKRKVTIRLACSDGKRARFKGLLDLEGEALGVAGRFGRRRSTLTIEKASAAVCGNTVIETGEQCDDGNTTGGDGCSAACMSEVPVELDETEPNDTPPTSNPAGSPPLLVHGAVQPVGDLDFFRIELAGSSLVLETSDGGGPGSCGPDTDTVVELWGPDGFTLIGADDDSGVEKCSRLEVHDLTPGVYFPCVRAFSYTAVPAYQLQMTVP
jgi:cysteine-rich repeat protein